MSVLRPRPPEDLLVCEVLTPDRGTPEGADHDRLVPALAMESAPGDAAHPLVAPVHEVERLLAEYGVTRSQARRRESRLFAILDRARSIAADADRVILLGDPATLAGPRLLLATCAHPWHDQLGRGDRGGRPRLVFLPAEHDPDAVGGLLDLVAPPGWDAGADRDVLDRVSLVIVGTPAATATADIVALLRPAVGERVFHTDATIGHGPAPGDGPGSVLGAAGLLAGALAGIDVVRLLAGAAALLTRCRSAAGSTPLTTLVRALDGGPWPARVLLTRQAALAPLADWYRHVLGAAGVAGVLLPGGPAGAGCRHLAVTGGAPRRDLPRATAAGEGWTAAAPARLETDIAHLRAAGCGGAVIRLPRVDEHAIGQVIALLLLATAVESRWHAARECVDAPSGERCDGGGPGL
jgi:hypothetical protein